MAAAQANEKAPQGAFSVSERAQVASYLRMLRNRLMREALTAQRQSDNDYAAELSADVLRCEELAQKIESMQ